MPRTTHDMDLDHHGVLADDAIAGGTPAVGDVPVSNADGTRTWGPAAGTGTDSYHHNQGSAATTWTVDHNLGRHPNVSVLDSAGSQVEVGVAHTSLNQVVLSLAYATSGTADCS